MSISFGSNDNGDIKNLSLDLAARAETFCRHFFPDGHKAGIYWKVGDTSGAQGQSLSIRLRDHGGRKAGNWTDFASGEFGDLIDLLHANKGNARLGDTLNLCRSFLGETPQDYSNKDIHIVRSCPAAEANQRTRKAQKLFAIGKPTFRTLASAYLLGRGIKRFGPALRYHPTVYVRPDEEADIEQHPALLAKITNNRGIITGVARTFLNAQTKGLAELEDPKRVLGQLYGNAIRFGKGKPSDDLIVGEGLENVLSIGTALPEFDLASCLTANHLGVFDPPQQVKRLWIARDNDAAGEAAARRLKERIEPLGMFCGDLIPETDDFNDDIQKFGGSKLADNLLRQMSQA